MSELQRKIDEKEQVESALRRERELMDKLFESVPVMLLMWDRNLRVFRVNAEVGRVLGWTGEDARSSDFLELAYPDSGYREQVRAFMRSAEPGWRDMEMIARNGDHVLTAWSNVVLSDDTHVGIGIDISERRRYEEQTRFLAEASTLLSSSLNYEKTLQALADLVVPRFADWCVVHIVQPDGSVKSLAIAHVNPEVVTWARELQVRYPFDPDSPAGIAKVLCTGKPELYPQILDEMLVKGSRDEEHLRIMRQVGFRSVLIVPLIAREQTLGSLSLIWSETERHYNEQDVDFMEQLARKAAIGIDNSRLYKVAEDARHELQEVNASLEERIEQRTQTLAQVNEELRSEIEERQATEAALEQANTLLQQRNRELQDFAYVASHDLKEPLRKVQTFAELIQDEYGEVLDETALGYLERTRSAADRMSSLIDDLLAFSRVATTGQPFTRVDLGRIAREVLQDLEARIRETRAEIELEALPAIEADATQMRQLLQNLIANALKFHRDGHVPRVHIEANGLGTPEGSGREMVQLTVRDQGIGFEQRFADRIFAPFQRLHGRAEFEGTGIGLAICRRIVERHGGSISAKGVPGEGAVFTAMLPVRQGRGWAEDAPISRL